MKTNRGSDVVHRLINQTLKRMSIPIEPVTYEYLPRDKVYDSDSEKFDLGDNEIQVKPNYRSGLRQFHTGTRIVMPEKIYDSSKPGPQRALYDTKLLYLAKLAIAFFNIREGAYFGHVKVLMAVRHCLGIQGYNLYITFQAISSKTNNANSEVPITFQTKILVPIPVRRGQLDILFVRIKPDRKKSKRRQISVSDHKARIRLTQFLRTYTIDSRLDSRYSLALYLSQYALAKHVGYGCDSEHDIESLKVLKLVKPDVKFPTYIITFQAPLLAVTEGKSVETFETEICMPTLFPTTSVETITIELKSKLRVIQPHMDASELKPHMDASEVKPSEP